MTQHPITRIVAARFAAFADVSIDLAPGLNVIIGENGAGKSQLLKLLYSLTSTLATPRSIRQDSPTKSELETQVAEKLVGVFRPDALGRLTNRRQGRTRAQVAIDYDGLETPLEISFSSSSTRSVSVDSLPKRWIDETPVFLPTRELLSIYPGFVALFDERVIDVDETWRDTAALLARPARRGPRDALTTALVGSLEQTLGGSVVEEGGKFYLKQPGRWNLEAHLVAEGLRKLAMIVRLISSGTIAGSGYLFWDEPEANLNARTLKGVAEAICTLARSGVQTFIATHSLFLLREIELLTAGQDQRVTYIGLHPGEDGVAVSSGESVSDIGDIAALDEEIAQTDRILQVEP